MTDPVELALAVWGMRGADCTFVAGRENRVYKVTHDGAAYALRFKRPGYRDLEELTSELAWMAEMARAGLSVPAPRLSREGRLLEELDGHYVDLITWLGGRPLGRSRDPLQLPDAAGTFRNLGAIMARMHSACDAWTPPFGFTRCRWDSEGLLGDAPLWGRFWENPTLDAGTSAMLRDFRSQAARALAALDLDTGLIHADFVRENVMIDGPALHLIDFDDGGYGYRLFDVATALLKNRAEPTYPALKQALLEGYQSVRPLDMTHLDLFLALRAVTYVGWIVPRMEEDGSPMRNTRFVKDAQELCSAWLAQMAI